MKLYPGVFMAVLIAAMIAVSSYAVYAHYNPGYQNTTDGKIQFTQSGLLAGTNWTVKISGVDYTEQETTNSSEMNFSSLTNGIYSYSIVSETGYSMQQSGQTNASGYSGVVYVGDIHAQSSSGYNSYPQDIGITLNFTLLTPSVALTVTSLSSNPYKYLIYVPSASWSVKLNYVNFTISNTAGKEYTLTMNQAMNRNESVGGIWTVNVSGSSYLSGGTVIAVNEIFGTTGDADVSQFTLVYTLTDGTIGSIVPV